MSVAQDAKSAAVESAADQLAVEPGTGIVVRPPGGLPAKPCIPSPGMAPEMVIIPAGRFYMGSPDDEVGRGSDEGPRYGVTVVQPFALSRCEVTVGEFRVFVEETGYVADSERKGCFAWNDAFRDVGTRNDRDWRNPGFEQQDDHPVVCVSWRDARAYARWLSLRTGERYRLPSEAEWEYAARAGTATARYWGDDEDNSVICAFANGADLSMKSRFADWQWDINACEDGYDFTAPVGRFQRNGSGLSDMLGNAWEWTADCWHESYSEQSPVDGSPWLEGGEGDCSLRVLRGGGWIFDPLFLRSASRSRSTADDASGYVGFRLARAL